MSALSQLRVVALEDFVAVDEPGGDALVGRGDEALIPEGGDVMVYGAGGAGKTTLVVDLALHLAAGDSWLGVPVARHARVLIVEAEGPRPMFRRKLDRKLSRWEGSPLGCRVSVLEEPWGAITLADESSRAALAATIQRHEIDVLIAGPLTRIGMEAAGTLQEVAAFVGLVAELRARSGRRLVVILVHHEGKSGAVSGAWEGAGDTLLHVEGRGKGRTHLHIKKARWSSTHHDGHLDLAWTDGEGFTVEAHAESEAEHDRHAELQALLADGRPRTVKEIAAKPDAPEPGIGAGEKRVKSLLAGRPDLYVERNGNEVGRGPRAIVYELRSGQNAVDAVEQCSDVGGLLSPPPTSPEGGGGERSAVRSASGGVQRGAGAVDSETSARTRDGELESNGQDGGLSNGSSSPRPRPGADVSGTKRNGAALRSRAAVLRAGDGFRDCRKRAVAADGASAVTRAEARRERDGRQGRAAL